MVIYKIYHNWLIYLIDAGEKKRGEIGVCFSYGGTFWSQVGLSGCVSILKTWYWNTFIFLHGESKIKAHNSLCYINETLTLCLIYRHLPVAKGLKTTYSGLSPDFTRNFYINWKFADKFHAVKFTEYFWFFFFNLHCELFPFLMCEWGGGKDQLLTQCGLIFQNHNGMYSSTFQK